MAAFFVALVLMGASALAQALIVDMDPDWQESEVPAPSAFNRDTLLPLEMPPYVSLQFGIDPASLAITPDGIVRYVVVARSTSGSVTAFYEGIRCATAEFKTYARANNEGVWTRPNLWNGVPSAPIIPPNMPGFFRPPGRV